MSYSAHRPGRYGSDGNIEFAVAEEEPLYLSDLQEAADGEADPIEDAPVVTAVSPEPASAPAPEPSPEPASAPAPEPSPEPIPEPAAAPVIEPEPDAEPESTRRAASPRRRRMPASRALAILGGAQGGVLDDVPSETSRFVQMFFVLVGTAVVSALSMLFALLTGVRISPWVAVPIALVWALIIFNLDRFLTSTMRSTRNVFKLIGLAIPRVIMAALIGVVVAEPLVLQAFHNDIAREVTSSNVVQAQADQTAVTSGPEKQALDAASARVAALENQAATGIVAGTSSTTAGSTAAQQTVDQLTTQVADQQKVIDQARALYQCELTGQGAGTVPGCTGVVGNGASSTAAQAQLQQAQTSYDALAAQLQQAQTALAAANAAGADAATTSAAQNIQQANDELPAARLQYDAALAAYNDRAASVAGGNADAVGLLSQMSALERLSAQQPALGWAHWMIAALFFMIELLPVLVKVLTSYGDPTVYEKAEAMQRQVELDRVTARTWRERAEIATTTSPA